MLGSVLIKKESAKYRGTHFQIHLQRKVERAGVRERDVARQPVYRRPGRAQRRSSGYTLGLVSSVDRETGVGLLPLRPHCRRCVKVDLRQQLYQPRLNPQTLYRTFDINLLLPPPPHPRHGETPRSPSTDYHVVVSPKRHCRSREVDGTRASAPTCN